MDIGGRFELQLRVTDGHTVVDGLLHHLKSCGKGSSHNLHVNDYRSPEVGGPSQVIVFLENDVKEFNYPIPPRLCCSVCEIGEKAV